MDGETYRYSDGAETEVDLASELGKASRKVDKLFGANYIRGFLGSSFAGADLDFHSFRDFFCVQIALRLPLMKVKLLMRHRDIQANVNIYAGLGLQDVGDDVWILPPLFPSASEEAYNMIRSNERTNGKSRSLVETKNPSVTCCYRRVYDSRGERI